MIELLQENLFQLALIAALLVGLCAPAVGTFIVQRRLSLLGDAQNAGTELALNSPVTGGRVEDRGIVLEIGGADPVAVRCRLFVNAAGLAAPALARKLEGMPG